MWNHQKGIESKVRHNGPYIQFLKHNRRYDIGGQIRTSEIKPDLG